MFATQLLINSSQLLFIFYMYFLVRDYDNPNIVKAQMGALNMLVAKKRLGFNIFLLSKQKK